ncbi:MAG: DUF47 family protein, partial [Bacteroidales bacterium]|nr:DUF47 family protein [Bacteroidales bacterium]
MGLNEIFSRKSDRLEKSVGCLLETVDAALIVFKEGVKNYLYGDEDSFTENLGKMVTLESESSSKTREIENMLYSRGYLIRSRGDIMRLLERLDHIFVIISTDLIQFEIESPKIPNELKREFVKL